MKLIHGLSASLLVTVATISLVQPYAMALSSQEVNTIARQVTVQIDGQNPGSGVIVARQGQTYTVLTAAHVVATQDEYDVITADGQKHPIDYKLVRKFAGVDLALITFTSPKVYQVVAMGSSSQLKEDMPIYVAGFPRGKLYQFSEGEVGALSTRPIGEGYAMAYLNDTFAGMSGGPVLNRQGQLVGIHGASKVRNAEDQGVDPTSGVKSGLNLGIPIDTFLRLVPQVSPTLKFPTAPPLAATTQVTASDLVIQAADQLIVGKPKEALATMEQAIRLQPNYASAYIARGVFRSEVKDYRGAIADYDQAIRLNPNSSFAYLYRGNARINLKDYRGAIADYDQTVRLSPNFSLAYASRGIARFALKDSPGAIADCTEAIRLDPSNALAYNGRAIALVEQANYRGAIADYTTVIRLNPKDALAFTVRGVTRVALADVSGAIADLQQGATLAQQQGQKEVSEMAIKTLKTLGANPNARTNTRSDSNAAVNNGDTVRIAPAAAISQYERGSKLVDAGDRQAAIVAFSEAIRLHPTYLLAYIGRAMSRLGLKDRQGAIADFSTVIRLESSSGVSSASALAYLGRGSARLLEGDKPGAIPDLQQAAKLAKQTNQRDIYQQAATLLSQLGAKPE
jgi:tetratricopeptide (TPR) repeat protein